jgi:hypothetical protein
MVTDKKNDRRQDEHEEDVTDRLLLSLVFDVSQLAENVERVKVQVFAIAKERGLVHEGE